MTSPSESLTGGGASQSAYSQIFKQIHLQGFAPLHSCKAVIVYAKTPSHAAKTTFSPQGIYLDEPQLSRLAYWECTPTSLEDQAEVLSEAFEKLAFREMPGASAFKIKFWMGGIPALKYSKKSDGEDRRLTFNLVDEEDDTHTQVLYAARFEGIPGLRRFHSAGITRTPASPRNYAVPSFSGMPSRAVTEEENRLVLDSISKWAVNNFGFGHEGTLTIHGREPGDYKGFQKALVKFLKIPRGLSMVDQASSSEDRRLKDIQEAAEIARRMERRKMLRARRSQ